MSTHPIAIELLENNVHEYYEFYSTKRQQEPFAVYFLISRQDRYN